MADEDGSSAKLLHLLRRGRSSRLIRVVVRLLPGEAIIRAAYQRWSGQER